MLKKVIQYIFIFLVILIFNLICSPVNLDEIWNYGFSNNLYRGLLPYSDFNMVIPIFYPWLMSLPFYLFSSNMLVFHITNAVLVTASLVLLEKMYQDKMWIFFLFFFFPVNAVFPSYNFFLFILLVSLCYVEKIMVPKYSWSHYLVGFLLGITILTKHTVGFFLLFPSLYYFKHKKFLLKRVIGCLVPVSIFIIYLVISGSFSSFINLCILGLFDFSYNSEFFTIYMFFFLIILFSTIYFIKKNPKDIINYYVLCFYSIVVPIVDLFHFLYAFLAFLLLVCFHIKKKYLNYPVLSIICVLALAFITAKDNSFNLSYYPNDINHFYMRFINYERLQFTKKMNRFLDENKDKRIVFLSSDSYYFKIINDEDIGYIDLINQGNLGYQGSSYLLSQIKKMEDDTLFLVNPNETVHNQTDPIVLEYVLKHGKKIQNIDFYEVYVMEE